MQEIDLDIGGAFAPIFMEAPPRPSPAVYDEAWEPFWALAEEAGGAYKDIDQVVAATEAAGISRRVAPVGRIIDGITVVRLLALSGHAAEPAVTVRITWADGARRTVPLNPDGTFLTFVRSRPGTEGEYRTIDALDRQGKVVTSDPHG